MVVFELSCDDVMMHFYCCTLVGPDGQMARLESAECCDKDASLVKNLVKFRFGEMFP